MRRGTLSQPSGLSRFPDTVVASCTATVGDEELSAQISVPGVVWDDPGARGAIEESLRFKLIAEILKKWTPVIKIERS